MLLGKLKCVISSLGNYDKEKELKKETLMGFISIFQGHEYKKPLQNINSFLHIKIIVLKLLSVAFRIYLIMSPYVSLWVCYVS